MSVGEVYLLDPHRVASYYGHDDELHLSFNFIALHGPWSAEHWNREIRVAQAAFDPVNAWPTWVLSNHDQTRHRQRYGGSERIARAAAVLLLTLRGTPFLYAGEELGLVDAEVPREQQQDPQGRRDGCRAPIPWDPTSTHGWQRSDNWLPFPPESTERNAATLRSDPNSILHLYRRLLELRRSSRPLQVGDMNVLDAPSGLVSWERSVDDDRVVVAVNMTNEPVSFALEGAWSTAIDSAVDADGDRRPYDGTVAPQSGVVLIPAT
jgi:alpha-glucosidase